MSTYRDEQLKRLDAVRLARENAVQIFFDSKEPTPVRLKAAPSSGTFVGAAEIERGKEIFRDSTEDAEVRAAALNALSNELTRDEALVHEVIALLADAQAAVPLRLMAMSTLQASEFASVVLPRARAEYKRALRGLLDDPSPTLQQFAAEKLAVARDRDLQDRLIAGLKGQQRPLVSAELAIQYLANDLHAETLPLLRELVAKPPSAEAKKEALRNLAKDPQSRDLLVACLLDPKEEPETRHVCLVGLFRSDPTLAAKLGRQVVDDPATPDELRAAILNTLAHLGSHGVASDSAFDARVAKLASEASSEPLRQMANSYRKQRS